MNTQTIQWQAFKQAARRSKPFAVRPATHPLTRTTWLVARALLAVTPALAIVVAGTWAAVAGVENGIVPAAIWGLGFVFMALAIENRGDGFPALLASGLALTILAPLASRLAAEFAILAAVIVAVWIATALWRRTGRRNPR